MRNGASSYLLSTISKDPNEILQFSKSESEHESKLVSPLKEVERMLRIFVKLNI